MHRVMPPLYPNAIPPEAMIYFLPPGIPRQYHNYTRYINQPPFEHCSSYRDAVRKLETFAPNAVFRNVLISYSVTAWKRHPQQEAPYRASEGISFAHPEINGATFQQLLRCCDPQNNHSLEKTKDCWNQIFPDSLSGFNLNVPEKDLSPGVQENLRKYSLFDKPNL